MKKRPIFTLIFLLSATAVQAQKLHSHNDYEQQRPFYLAYELNFDSIEADLYLKEGELYVAHDFKDVKANNTFNELYLKPLLAKIEQNKGYPYPNRKSLQVLIDLKTNGEGILTVLNTLLKPHQKALKHVKIVISGDMPKPEAFSNYDKIFFFDGRNNLSYAKKEWKRVGLVSASLMDFGKYWVGKEPINPETSDKIKQFVAENHQKGKAVRLWATPNTSLAFETLKKLDVDFIGADSLRLVRFTIYD